MEHCKKLFHQLTKHSNLPVPLLVHLKGEVSKTRLRTDVDLSFRQESNFLYLTGVEKLADCYFWMLVHKEGFQTYFFMPKIHADEAIWIGEGPDPKEIQKQFHFDHVYYTEEMESVFKKLQVKQIGTLEKELPSYLNQLPVFEGFQQSLIEARVIKSEKELELMKQANKKSGQCHLYLMENAHQFKSEKDFLIAWYQQSLAHQMFEQAYLPIVAYGENAAILHYTKNDAPIPANPEGFFLVDAGGEYHGYAADITRSYPLSGKFSPLQRLLYETVLNAQIKVIERIKPGVEWEELHRYATELICEGLIKMQVIEPKGKSVKELCWELFLPQIFFPHGLGHLIGLDVHDVGGYPPRVERIQEPAIRYLRMRRKLEAGMVVTVEPGCYFVKLLLDQAYQNQKQSSYLNQNRIKEFMKLGGVRIEDCVAVTETGYENLTTAPKQIEELEKILRK